MSLIDSSGSGAQRVTEPSQELANKTKTEEEKKTDSGVGKCAEDDNEDPAYPLSSSDRPSCLKSEDCLKSGETSVRVMTQPAVPKEDQDTPRDEGSHCGDHYMSGRSESDDYEEEDDVVLLLSEQGIPCVTEDESHYITTHEIQLSELSDHESDLGVGSSTSWDLEEDNQVCSFVDYAIFDSNGGERGDGRQPLPQSQGETAAARRTQHDAAKLTSSDECGSNPQQQQGGGNSGGQIHLSIRTTSRAINDPSNVHEHENILFHATRSGDMSQYVFKGVDGKAETLCERPKCFIAAPRHLHFGIREYSSGASSAVSELDEADKEVRNLTARAFKSLAYPYFDAFNFSTSSDSSASEHGLGRSRLSTFIDLKYGNMNSSQGLGQGVVSHPNSTASFQNEDNRVYKGIGLASINPPSSKLFTLNSNPHNATSSTKQIELKGKFGQGHSGVITLTETLRFHCNVKSGMSGGERRANFAQNAAGSCSGDEVTSTLPSSQRRGARQQPSKTMEDTHKKAIFASSLIKNVISKKMQFEQERKMERGEISEPHQTPSPSLAHNEGKGSAELHRQSSKLSESSSDYATMCVDEVEDIRDSSSSRRLDVAASEPADEAGIDTKKGSKSTLLRSQNSAFRCWKDEELEFQKDHKNHLRREDTSPAKDAQGEEDRGSSRCGKPTQMSHLFVPSIQLLSAEEEVGQQPKGRDHLSCGDAVRRKLRADNTLYVTDSGSVAASKSPEIKIHLKSVRNNQSEPFGVSKRLTPNIGCNAACSLIRTDDFKCQALAAALRGESADKVPQFTVRDIRDSKGKLQTPIHHVRDVRKLVKSSYHLVSLDNKDNRSNVDSQLDQKKQISYRNPNSVSPIVIKCQSVNTNNNGKQCGNHTDLPQSELVDVGRSSPERTAGRAPIGKSSEGDPLLRTENIVAPKKLEKTSDISDKKTDSKMTNQGALEKLQAAVKTMEQLYVFDRNEWKRKTEPQPLTDSHVLQSLIAGKEHGGPEEEGARGSNIDKTTPVASPGNDALMRREDKLFQVAGGRDARLVGKLTQATSTTGNQNMVSLSSSSTAPKTAQQNTVSEAPFSNRSFVPKSPKLLSPFRTSQTKPSGHKGAKAKDLERSTQELSSSSAENENYLTIPVKSHISSSKQASLYTLTTETQPTSPSTHVASCTEEQEEPRLQSPKRSSIEMETFSPEIPSATIYHSMPLGLNTNQPQVFCFSPAMTPTPTLEPFQATQRKMLLDPATGNYYLVDTPVQPATKRLFDPETGQYVDVSMPQPTTTPVPMQISPLALCPGAYGHTYMIYPGFMPAPSVIPARTLAQSQMSVQLEAESEEKASSQKAEGMYMESPFYMATGGSPQTAAGAQQQATGNKPLQGFPSMKQPVISITSQQGPRIIAPPSFDGTTMSFVVEHR